MMIRVEIIVLCEKKKMLWKYRVEDRLQKNIKI